MINAYVLHSILYRETSLIVKFFTKEYGIINLVARGVKRKKNSLAAILQPFVPLSIYWKQHNVDLATLYQAEANGIPHKLTGVFLFGSLYINELLLKLLAVMDPHAELFDFYKQFLENLEHINNKTDLEKNLRFIEKKILKAMGYELQLDRESKTNVSIDLTAQYYFDFENGLQKSINSIININLIPTFRGASLLALHNDHYSNSQERQEAKLFMRYILAIFLGKKTLNTKKLFI
ncbi:MAG: DNA repair protein RecO [Gammaproteobacteria bacterium]|jgi:DNA repair protein RecO (recombination protein O)